MVHYQRYHQWRKWEPRANEEDEESHGLVAPGCANSAYYKRKRPKIFYLLVISLLSCCFVLAPQLFSSSTFSILCECFFFFMVSHFRGFCFHCCLEFLLPCFSIFWCSFRCRAQIHLVWTVNALQISISMLLSVLRCLQVGPSSPLQHLVSWWKKKR